MTNQSLKASKRSTITDVAKLANVSISTVSRVLNDTAPVANGTVERVQAAIEELNFQPHPVARSLAGGKTHTLGILVPELTNPFFSLLFSGIEQGIRDGGFDLLIHLTRSARFEGGRLVNPLNEHNTDGLIVFADNLAVSELERLYAQAFPLVVLFRPPPSDLAISSVTVDNVGGARAAVDHLIEDCGCRQIAFLQGLVDNDESNLREIGYRQSMASHNLPIDESLIARGNFYRDSCEPAVKSWLGRPDKIDAIFADNDILAVDVVAFLKRAGVRIPDQLAVVGFDDLTIAQHVTPALTTVRSPIVEAGRRAAELLIQTIETGKTECIQLSTDLVVRHSSSAKICA